MRSPLHQIEAIREMRARRERDTTIAGVVQRTADDASRTQKKLGELIALWEELVPTDLASHTALGGYRAGVLHVVVDSSSAAFELDRLLRSGLTAELRGRFRGTLTRVKTRIGRFDDSQ